jgi:hypothetical protein|nr:MAG TPA: hypothetical protein [Caudoviricetes sp.]
MTKEQAELLKLGFSIDDTALLIVESALQWVLDNTTLQFDINKDDDLKALPANVRLFVVKYKEVMSTDIGVSSESIEGLSQSFNTGDKNNLLWDIAYSLLGDCLISPVSFVSAVDRWK